MRPRHISPVCSSELSVERVSLLPGMVSPWLDSFRRYLSRLNRESPSCSRLCGTFQEQEAPTLGDDLSIRDLIDEGRRF